MFTGCGAQNTVSDQGATKVAEQTTAAASTTPSEEAKPKIKWLSAFANFDLYNDPSAKIIRDLTGYDFEYEMLPAENSEDKLNLIMSSGEEYDVVMIPNKDLFYKYAKQGALTDIGDILAKEGQNVITAIEQKYIDAVKVDGKVYGLPSPSGMDNLLDQAFYIRKDWLDAVGMQSPKTIDEYTAVLKAFKEKNPGKVENVIPLTINDNPLWNGFLGAFGVASEYVVDNGKLVNRVKTAGMKEFLAYMNSLYTQGLIDKGVSGQQGLEYDGEDYLR